MEIRRVYGPVASPGRRVPIREAFSPEFAPAIEEFVRLLRVISTSHNRVVLMARKTVCLYHALVRNGELDPLPEDVVISSRALSLGGAFVSGFTVAVVDDVMVRGESALKVAGRVRELGGDPTLVVIAYCSRLIEGALPEVPLVAVRELDESQVYRLSREIVCYIQASGITNNVDQPIFYCEEPASPIAPGLSWADVTTRMQRRKGVRSYTCSLGHREVSGPDLPVKVFQKIRIILDMGTLTVIPFVILPPLGLGELRSIGGRLLPRDLLSEAGECDGEKGALSYLLRCVRYALAATLGARFLRWCGIGDCGIDARNERLLFSRKYEWEFESDGDVVLPREPLGGPERVEGLLGRSQGLVVSELLSLADSGCAHDTGLSFYEIARILGEGLSFARLDPERVFQLASTCLDVMVDEGMLVPFTRTAEEGDEKRLAERAYRGGEVFTLTCGDIDLLSALATVLLGDADGLSVEHRTRRVMNRAFVVFLRWQHEDGRRDIGIADMASWDFEYAPERGAACLPSGLTLVDMVERHGAMREDGRGALSSIDGYRASEDLRGIDAVKKFAGDLRSIERGSPYSLGDGSEASLEEVLETMVMGGHRAYQLRRLQPLVEEIPLAIDALEKGRPQEARRLTRELSEASDAERVTYRHNEVASLVAQRTSVTEYDFRRYSGASCNDSVDTRLYRHITKTCHSLARELDGIIGERDEPCADRTKRKYGDSVDRLRESSEAIGVLIADSSQDWGAASLRMVESVSYTTNRTTDIKTSPQRLGCIPSGSGAAEWVNAISKEVLERTKFPVTVYFPGDDPCNAVIPRRGLGNGEGGLSIEDIFPRGLRVFITGIVTASPKCKVIVICYRKSTGFRKKQLLNALEGRGLRTITKVEAGLGDEKFYLDGIYNYLFVTPDKLSVDESRQLKKRHKESASVQARERRQTVNNNIYLTLGDSVGGDKFGGDKVTVEGNGIGKSSAPSAISYGGGRNLMINGSEGDISLGLDALESLEDLDKDGIKDAVSDVRECCEHPERYGADVREATFTRLKGIVEGANSLHDLWAWLAPLLVSAMQLAAGAL